MGGTKLVRDHPLPARRAAACVKTIAEAPHFAHQPGTLHRDLKPSNILLDPFDRLRIADFGLARQHQAGSELTLTGQGVGSPGSMPPELTIGGRSCASPASDLYSLGAILDHAVTGRPPFPGETLHELLRQTQESEPVSPRLREVLKMRLSNETSRTIRG